MYSSRSSRTDARCDSHVSFLIGNRFEREPTSEMRRKIDVFERYNPIAIVTINYYEFAIVALAGYSRKMNRMRISMQKQWR